MQKPPVRAAVAARMVRVQPVDLQATRAPESRTLVKDGTLPAYRGMTPANFSSPQAASEDRLEDVQPLSAFRMRAQRSCCFGPVSRLPRPCRQHTPSCRLARSSRTASEGKVARKVRPIRIGRIIGNHPLHARSTRACCGVGAISQYRVPQRLDSLRRVSVQVVFGVDCRAALHRGRSPVGNICLFQSGLFRASAAGTQGTGNESGLRRTHRGATCFRLRLRSTLTDDPFGRPFQCTVDAQS